MLPALIQVFATTGDVSCIHLFTWASVVLEMERNWGLGLLYASVGFKSPNSLYHFGSRISAQIWVIFYLNLIFASDSDHFQNRYETSIIFLNRI